MAVTQISKIQVRRGDARVTGLPELSAGEFGLAISGTTENSINPELYIGNQTDLGVQNVRVLTEYDNIFDIGSNKVYTYNAHGSANIVSAIARTIADKLDDSVTLFDFVGTQTPGANYTVALQNAINELYLTAFSTRSRVALRIPAGNYEITDTIFLPPFTTLVGDGAGKTTLTLTGQLMPMFMTVNGNGDIFGSNDFHNYEAPQNIGIVGITMQYASALLMGATLPLLAIDCAENSYVLNCEFKGSYDWTTGVPVETYAGIQQRGDATSAPKNFVVYGSTFENISHGIYSNSTAEDSLIENNRFVGLSRGISYGELLPLDTSGPVRSTITKNWFTNIAREGIFVGANNGVHTDHLSSFNRFIEVGEVLGTQTPIIDFQTGGNRSVEDKFSRQDALNEPNLYANFMPLIAGKSYRENSTVAEVAVTESQSTPNEITKFVVADSNAFITVDYTLVQSTTVRTGKVTINVSQTPSLNASVTDAYTYSGTSDGNVVFTVSVNNVTNTVTLGYTSLTSDGVITYKYNQLQ